MFDDEVPKGPKPKASKPKAPRMTTAEIKAKQSAFRVPYGRIPTSYCLGDTFPSNWSRVKLRCLTLYGS